MATTVLRVHQLAKDLGVDSKDIIAKCKAEGIELKNHMAPISAGLSESIREWFSVTADITSVESAAPVDIEVLAKRRKKAPAQIGASGESDAHDESHAVGLAEPHDEADEAHVGDSTSTSTSMTPIAEAEPQPSRDEIAPSVITMDAEVVSPTVAAPEPVADVPPMRVTEAPSGAPAPVGETIVAPARPSIAAPTTIAAKASPAPMTPPSRIEPPAPVKPVAPHKPVTPAGPQLVPKPAALQGPRVVRIEAPEPVSKPRPRPAPYERGPGGGYQRPAAGPGAPQTDSGPPRGPKVVPKTKAEEEREKARTARSPRRHDRGEEVTERLKEWRDQDVIERMERLAHASGQGLRARRHAEARRQASQSSSGGPGKPSDIKIVVPIALREFCSAIGTTFNALSRKLIESTGNLYRITDMIDAETVEMLALEFGAAVQIEKAKTALEKFEHVVETRERKNPKPRPPVVAMLGHVDHGKTSLLDAIRRTTVAKGEAGGITQRIGAYRIDRGEWHVTFLDTPGHQAFTAMRARGANLTDVVVLVVAADDGVMPQTVEAINHAKAAGVHIVIAMNKIDMPGVDMNRVYGQLAEQNLIPTEWGGTVDVIKTSATKGEGIDDLIAHLSTLTELMDLKADPDVSAVGSVIESHMQEGRGVAAQILIREGTLKVGQHVVCGAGFGRVRSLIDDRGNRMQSAGPATPVEVGGLDTLPQAGDKLYAVPDAATAKEIAAEVAERRKVEARLATRKPATLEDLLAGAGADELPELNLIIKADGQSRIDVMKAELGKLPTSKAKLRILHTGVGAISEADVELAKASRAVVFGFDVIAEDRAQAEADSGGVQVRVYRVIYELIDDVRKAMEGLLEPEYKHELRAKVEVRQVYSITKVGSVAGCNVLDGVIHRNHKVRLVRDGRIVLDGSGLQSLKRFKDDAKEVRAGMDCGIKIENFDDVKPGDIIEAYEVVEKRQSLE
ncbi:MAG: translation initiation factor IF-2 [Phycisphaerae bacterium]